MNSPIGLIPSTRQLLFVLLLSAGTLPSVLAQNTPSGTVSASGSGPFTYSLSFTAPATQPIGSIWYAWTPSIPPYNYLPGAPTPLSAPPNWTAFVVNGGSTYSIQFSANSATDDIAPGTTGLFSYEASFSPAQLDAAPNSAKSYAYSDTIFTSGAQQFDVQTVPEPSTLALVLLGSTTIAARRRLRAA